MGKEEVLIFVYCPINAWGFSAVFRHYHLLFRPAAAAKLLQSCPPLCDPIDGSPPGSPVPGFLQARTLGWVAISFSNAWKEKWKWSRSVMSDSSRPHGLQPARLLHPWDFPGKSTGVGCHALLQRTFLTQGFNLCLLLLLHCRQILYSLSLYLESLPFIGITTLRSG